MGKLKGRDLRKVKWLQDLPRPQESTIFPAAPILSLSNSLPVPAGNGMIKAPSLTASLVSGADADGLGDPVGI